MIRLLELSFRPHASTRAATSIGSPSGVAVPCIAILFMSRVPRTFAAVRVNSSFCEAPLGVVSELDRPS